MSGFQTGVAESSASRENHATSFVKRRWPECLTLVAYAGLVAFTIPHHEPWSDEAQAWQVARSLPVAEIFRTYLRYEGHPGLWHLLLSTFIHLGGSYTGLPWLCGIIALVSASLVVFFAPFPHYIRIALPFTFFLAYQYAVVARSYVLVPLLLFLIAMTWRRSPLLVALLLGLLANVALHAFAISGGLAMLYAIEQRRSTTRQPRNLLWIAGILLLAFYSFAIWTVWPPPDLYLYRPEVSETLPLRLAVQMTRGLFAMAMGVLDPVWLAIPFWILLWRYLHRRRLALYLLPVATLELFSTQYLYLWHAGLVVPTLIAVFWIAPRTERIDTPQPGWEERTTAALLAYAILCQIGWTAHAVAFDYSHAYSPDLAAVRYLAPRIAAGEKIAVTALRPTMPQTYAVGLEPYFPQGLFMNRAHPFWFFSTKDTTEAAFPGALQQHPPLILAEFIQYKIPPRFDASRDLYGPNVELLRNNGYVLTQVLCGEQPYHFRTQLQICHLIFEPKP